MLRNSLGPGRIFLFSMLALWMAMPVATLAQGSAFTYQGKLTDGGTPATGQYDFRFELYDTATVGTGTQQGSTITVPTVQVTAGLFIVQLDFGSSVFAGAARYLELAVKQTSGSMFTTLGPRQPVTSNPYAVHSLNADGLTVACANCITSSQIQSIQGSKVTGSIAGSQISGAIPVASVPAGSSSYLQNRTSQQGATNFNISGNGTIGGNLSVAGALSLTIVDAQTQFNLAGSRLLAAPGTGNLFAGLGAGASQTTGQNNTLFGTAAGAAITTSSGNSFFGRAAGSVNTGGFNNSFFGDRAGAANTTGRFNSFFGEQAGANNTADDNSFFGRAAGGSNTTGSSNAFFGKDAGATNTTGSLDSFFGFMTGSANTTGGGNSFFGWSAGASNTTGCCNSFFGEATGSGNTTGTENSFFGDGAGVKNTTGSANTFIGRLADFGPSNGSGNSNTLIGARTGISSGVNHSTAIGANASVSTSNTIVLGTTSDVVMIPGLGTAGGSSLCRNSSNQVSFCSSSLRYKTDIKPFVGGLDIINRLNPITFSWIADGKRDVGLGAEDVAEIEPLFTFKNSKGAIEGVKYDQLNVVLINALKQQQAQINKQQVVIDELKKILCENHPNAVVCK